MNKHVMLLVDASGSMKSFEKETRNTIVSMIKELDKQIHFTLIFFDTSEYKVVCDDRVSNILPEVGLFYKAISGTPITDTIYKTIQDITNEMEYLEQLSEKHKMVIFTDGEENSSRYVNATQCGAAIEHMKESFGWEFQFLGPKSMQKAIRSYTNSLKIDKKGVTLYASIEDGLKEMKNKVIVG